MKATFAAGCFWHVEHLFSKIPGVSSTRVGYIGGNLDNPTYEQVCRDATGHAEAVEVTFDSEKVSFSELLDVFWSNHDPTSLNRQGPDVGEQYRSAIFYHDELQKTQAITSKDNLQESTKFSKPIVTQIQPVAEFYKAEEYHQQYIKKNSS